MPNLIRDNAAQWPAVLGRPDARNRPSADRWSPLEYACHVRDVFRLFDMRLHRMLDEDDPTFANWDQDETAVADRYGEQDPTVGGSASWWRRGARSPTASPRSRLTSWVARERAATAPGSPSRRSPAT